MNALTHTLGVLVGGPAFSEVTMNERDITKIVSAAPKVVSVEFYEIGRDEFVKRYKYTKRFAILAAVTTLHVLLILATAIIVAAELYKHGLSRASEFYPFAIVIGPWIAWLLAEGKLFIFLGHKYPRGASDSLVRGSDVASAQEVKIMARSSDPVAVPAAVTPEPESDDFMAWLASQPKARELAAIAERTFKTPDDLTTVAKLRQAHYDKVWEAPQAAPDGVQPLTR